YYLPLSLVFFFLSPLPPRSSLFPYTTLFRSERLGVVEQLAQLHADPGRVHDAHVEREQARKAVERTRIVAGEEHRIGPRHAVGQDRKSTRLNSSHVKISYAVFCLKKKNTQTQ